MSPVIAEPLADVDSIETIHEVRRELQKLDEDKPFGPKKRALAFLGKSETKAPTPAELARREQKRASVFIHGRSAFS